ncbi:unnamed protein product, partial [Ectocarpus sp. 12 AP-2014]
MTSVHQINDWCRKGLDHTTEIGGASEKIRTAEHKHTRQEVRTQVVARTIGFIPVS